ncbi:MAG: LacI family DNA-binding transcriptional regulator [Planctomycetota bacterium]|jgi:DNA-binding LacI/PurR family transcriptional regulator|nr:LacI family DNA-binding transcriptional regulator [Planctomycetota bacterium]
MPAGERVTLKDVAAHAGTSLQTVSQILNKDRDDLFRDETVTRVRLAARELGYRPNSIARSMRSGRSNCVGLVLDWNGYRSHNPPQLVSGLLQVLEKRGRHLILSRIHEEGEGAERAPEILREILADGLVVNYHTQIAAMEAVVEASGLPAVWVNAMRSCNAVIPDDRAAAEALVTHLIAAGHRHIVYCDAYMERYLGPERHFSKVERYQGYCAAMQGAGLKPVHAKPTQQEDFGWVADYPEATALVYYGVGAIDPRDLPDRDLCLAGFGEVPLQVGRRVMPTMVTDWDGIAVAVIDGLDALINGAESLPMVRVTSRLVLGDEAAEYVLRRSRRV